MADKKAKKGTRENPITQEDRENAGQRPYIIKSATLKDGYCNYIYEITQGTGSGDRHKVDGNGIYEDDLRHTFGRLNVHMAAIDDVFKHSGVEFENIDEYHGHEHAHIFNVTGFSISGTAGDESVELKGTKYVSTAGGRIELKTPKVPLDNLSSYPYAEALREALDNCREEVALYKEGKYTEDENDEEVENPKQLTIADQLGQEGGEDDGQGEEDDAFDTYLHK